MVKRFDSIFPITTYVCPLCQKAYSEYKQAEGCAKSHNAPDEFVGFYGYNERHNTADSIVMRLKDGKQVAYLLAAEMPDNGLPI